MRAVVLVVAAAVSTYGIVVARADAVKAPKLLPGDRWTYVEANPGPQGLRITHVVMTLVRSDKDGIVVDVHLAGAPGPGIEQLMGPDWSRVRSVNGRQTVVNQPLVFPLAPGRTWHVAYSEFTPSDRRHTRESWDMTMKVAGWESVEVPAGTFRALKIEGSGTWTADTAGSVVVARGRAPNGAEIATAQRNAPTTMSGRIFKVFWYVPEVHRWVKSQEDVFSSGGVRTGHATSDLEAFTPADPHGAAPPAQGIDGAAVKADRPKGQDAPHGPQRPEHPSGGSMRETRWGIVAG